MEIRFDHGPVGLDGEGACVFAAPRRMIMAQALDDVPGALAALDRARAHGAWLAGYASYELGYALEPHLAKLMPPCRRLPLLAFGIYDAPVPAPDLPDAEGILSELTPQWDEGRYAEAFAAVHAYIGAGDFYQANLTFPLEGVASGDPAALYAALVAAQPVRYGALVTQPGLPSLLSRSPELFFRTDVEGRIRTRPMQGTQPRSADPAEEAGRRRFLAQDEKNRAENLMIVDLLRNDLSRVCTPGSVTVPELFTIESYSTVHQMTSLITGQMRPDTGLSAIFAALFPCGSITGAPKMRAMQVLRELEGTPRDIYCGSIGWAAPDGRAEFNVAIRTLLLDGARVTLNVGGGVVYDSTAAAEYEEALWKTRFVRPLIRDLR